MDAISHATAVAQLSVTMGLRLEQYLIRERSRLPARHAREVVNLGVGAMLHDIGKTKLQPEVQALDGLGPIETTGSARPGRRTRGSAETCCGTASRPRPSPQWHTTISTSTEAAFRSCTGSVMRPKDVWPRRSTSTRGSSSRGPVRPPDDRAGVQAPALAGRDSAHPADAVLGVARPAHRGDAAENHPAISARNARDTLGWVNRGGHGNGKQRAVLSHGAARRGRKMKLTGEPIRLSAQSELRIRSLGGVNVEQMVPEPAAALGVG